MTRLDSEGLSAKTNGSLNSFPSFKVHFHLDGIGEGGCWPLAAPPHQGGRCLSSSSSSLAQPSLSPWTHLGGIRVENGFPVILLISLFTEPS